MKISPSSQGGDRFVDAAQCARAGEYVEIRARLLGADERRAVSTEAPGDLILRVRGTAVSSARVGDSVRVRTRIGRVLSGELTHVDPQHTHGFGRMDPELLSVRSRVWEWMARE